MKLHSLNVLFIAPEFYNYHHELIRSMSKLGANVTFISEMNQSISYRLLQKFSGKLKRYFENKHINKILSVSKNQDFDAIFIIRGGYLTPDIMRKLRLNNKDAVFYMYQWDSYRQNDYRSIIPFFDVVSTFDKDDAAELNLDYQPLFYTDIYKNIAHSKEEKEYDLVFYGAYHSDRLTIVKYFDDCFKKNGLVFKSHLYIKKIPLLVRLLKREIRFNDLAYFRTYSVSAEEISQSYAKTKAVLDVELSIQSGLSIRTFEVLGSGVKLVTTNKNISNESFYNPTQIRVINRNAIEINLPFFALNDNQIDVTRYHVDNWLERIFALTEKYNKGNRV